jgi:two-component system CheB/CheR fusion protein
METPEKSPPIDPTPDGLPAVAPDFGEELLQSDLDNIIPTKGYQMTPMVALGGSAGSVQALSRFFQAMPAQTGMVYVVVIHLSPTHESTMAELLGRSTKMPVVQAEDGQKVQPDHVYVIPPGKHLTTVDGQLRLVDLRSDRGRRVAVDLFFRSLADTHGPHAAAVVLSGADADGALGIKRIKERGGLTIAQDPDEAEHASMPRAAINTGMIDWVLCVADMPNRLLKYRDNEMRLKLPPEEGPQPLPSPRPPPDDSEAALRDVLIFLRTRTGCDFSYYKRATIVRRIGRRMQVNGVDDVPSYLAFLRTHAGEAAALLQDLLISVTNFFRDREAFLILQQHIPELFQGKSTSDAVRVWVPACATGEEAYSIAMLLYEHAQTLESTSSLQIFACDLDDGAIRTARIGHYPDSITADVSEERLRRFFIKDHAGYRVRRELRELVFFATHDLLKDPPFSRMDLISCRNLLIYLNREAQERVLNTLHFALKPDGHLFLGMSELVDDDSQLFRVVDKKYRLYARRPGSRAGLPMPVAPSALLRVFDDQQRLVPAVHGKRFAPDPPSPFPAALVHRHMDRATLTDLHFRLIERFAPPSIIVNEAQDVVHISEHAGEFLQFTGGEVSTNLLRIVRPELRVELRTALFRTAETGENAAATRVSVEIDGKHWLVNLRVSPAPDIAPGSLLVVFDKFPVDAEAKPPGDQKEHGPPEPVVRHLEREIELLKGRLRDTIEQSEASTEELKASNEELQAMNEELRSATEELETSREELQSINEELTTVNQEMKLKMDEIARANSDLQNLIASTAIAIIFLDRELSITRYTPTAVDLFHLIPGDLGRPLAHLQHRLEYPELIADAEQVLRTLVPIEREIRGDRDWFLVRLQPYRTLEDHIGGVVLTFVDITERRRTTEALKEQLTELERFNKAAVGRETRMIELKKEINELCTQLGQAPRFNTDFEKKKDNDQASAEGQANRD